MTDNISSTRKLSLIQDWDSILRGLLHKSFHNTHAFLFKLELLPHIYTGAPCVEKSLIDSSVKGQYATHIYLLYFFMIVPQIVLYLQFAYVFLAQ